MPPPYQRNPVRSARDEFLGERPKPYFFPEPGKSSTFGPYFSGRQLSNLNLETEDYLTKRDDMLARRRSNAFDHLENESKARVLPYEEDEKVAESQYRKTRAEADTRLSPFVEENQKEQAMTGTEVSKAIRGGVAERAELEKAERAARMDALLSNDPAEQELRKWTDDPNDLMSYRSLYNRTDPKLSKDERRAAAFKKTLRLSQDRAIISQLREAAALGIEGHDKIDALLEPEIDQEGNYYGDSIKNDPAARRAVQRILATNATQKARMAQEKEDRIADQANRGMILRALLDRKNDYDALVRENPADTEAKARRDEMNAKIDALLAEPKGQAAPQGEPAAPKAGQAPIKAGQADIDSLFFPSKAR